MEDVSVRTDAEEIVPTAPVNGLETERGIVFPTPDPQFLVVPPAGCSRLFVRVRFEPADSTDVWKAFEEALRFRGEAERACNEAERALGMAERAREEARRSSDEAHERIRAMEASMSWRITRPLRRMLDAFRQVFIRRGGRSSP